MWRKLVYAALMGALVGVVLWLDGRRAGIEEAEDDDGRGGPRLPPPPDPLSPGRAARIRDCLRN